MKIPDSILKQIQQRDITAREAAKTLNIPEQYICGYLKKHGIVRIPGLTITHRTKMSQLAKARREYIALLVIQVNNRSKTIEQAAREARCSTRTIYRHL